MAAMPVSPPKGSKISVTVDDADPVIIIRYSGGRVMRYFGVVFMLVGLTIWTFGLGANVWSALSGTIKGGGGAFGLVLMFVSVAESLKLRVSSLVDDSGIPPVQMQFGYLNSGKVWKSLFPKRTRVELDRHQLRPLRLRETDSGKRLTFDLEASRVDIAPSASEIEREWLAQVLLARYP